MENKTVYTFDLTLKLNVAITASTRKLFWVITVLLGLVTAWNIYDDLSVGSTASYCMTALLLALFILFLAWDVLWSKWRLARFLRKQVTEDADPVLCYSFEEACILVERMDESCRVHDEMKYSIVHTIGKMDEQSCYIKTVFNTYYILHEESGIDPLCQFLVEKTHATPMTSAKRKENVTVWVTPSAAGQSVKGASA